MFHLYGFMIGLGVVSGIYIASKRAKHFGINPKLIEDSLLWITVPAIIGARLYHVITDWQLYQQSPLINILKIWNGGLGYFGALIGGILGLIVFIRVEHRRSIKVTNIYRCFLLLDLLSFGAPIAQAIGRFGNYFNQELYGLPTTLPWGIWIRGERYHPLFAYEAMGDLLIFIFVNWLGWKKKLGVGKGQYACIYIACYGLLRFWLEFLRIESSRWSGTFEIFSIAQWVSIGLTIGAIVIFWLRRHADRGIEWEMKTLL